MFDDPYIYKRTRELLQDLLNLDGNGTGGTSLELLRWRGHLDMYDLTIPTCTKERGHLFGTSSFLMAMELEAPLRRRGHSNM